MQSDTLNIGLIGCGMFVRVMHIPNLKKSPKFNIHAVMDIDRKVAEELAHEVGASYGTDDLSQLLNDEEIDAVFITTRHDSHAELTIQAALAGKHIMCEKPMALNAVDCQRVTQVVRQQKVKYTVGYNRGVAPLVRKAKNILQCLSGKRLIYHRIQAPFPADHWTHDPSIGGGRFVGEGCHIFDLMCELMPGEPVSVYASGGVFLDPEMVKIPDSGIVTITFSDGSIGTTLIASAGCPNFPKEVTEIYCDDRAIYIHDFQSLRYFGFDDKDCQEVSLPTQDKGQDYLIDMFADAVLNDTESPNSVLRAARGAVLSYKVVESIANGCVPIPVQKSDYTF